jgi:hypothetical protein
VTSTDRIAIAALIVAVLALLVAIIAATYSRRQAVAAEASIPAPPPAVDWRLERDPTDGFRLRNIGTEAATGVRLVMTQFKEGQVVTGWENAVVAAGASVRVSIYRNFQEPAVSELPVLWDGRSTPQYVAVPPAGSPANPASIRDRYKA